MELKTFFAQDAQGNVIPNPVARVYAPHTTNLVTGLKDKSGANLSNPFTGTIQGQLQFSAPDGDYDLRVTGAGRDYTVRVRFVDSAAALTLRDDMASPASGKGGGLVVMSHAATYPGGTLGAKAKDFPSVKDAPWNAKGDGVTNDTAALAAAIAASLYLRWPAGVYLVDTLPTPASGAHWIVDGNVLILRRPTSTANALLLATNPITVEGMIFDGNKGNNSTPCNCVIVTANVSKFDKCRFINAKAVGGSFGAGLSYKETVLSGDSDHTLWDCYAEYNDSDGAAGQNIRGLEAIGNTFRYNGKNGAQFNNYDLTLTDKLLDCRVIANYAYGNGQNGIYVGNFIQSNNLAVLDYGPLNLEAYRFILADNICRNNNLYGIAAQGEGLAVTNNTCTSNAQADPSAGGILMNAALSLCAGNICYANAGFGIDAGGSVSSIVGGNVIYINAGTGLNVGATVNTAVKGNHVLGNGGTNGIQIEAHSVDTDAAGRAFPSLTTRLSISGNYIGLTNATQRGVYLHDGIAAPLVTDNDFFGTNPENFVIAIAKNPTIARNNFPADTNRLLAVSAGGVIGVPDVLDFGYTSSTTTVTSLDYHTAQNVVGRTGVAWVDITNGGTGYTTPPTVVFSGGGGTGAAATAHVRNGVVIGIRMTNFGTGYTSPPSVSFVGGGGTGAAGTAQVSVPLGDWREFELYTLQACTINRSATPVVESKAAANLTMSERDAVRMRSAFGTWRVLGRA